MNTLLLLWMTFCVFYFRKVGSTRTSPDDGMKNFLSAAAEDQPLVTPASVHLPIKLVAEPMAQHPKLHSAPQEVPALKMYRAWLNIPVLPITKSGKRVDANPGASLDTRGSFAIGPTPKCWNAATRDSSCYNTGEENKIRSRRSTAMNEEEDIILSPELSRFQEHHPNLFRAEAIQAENSGLEISDIPVWWTLPFENEYESRKKSSNSTVDSDPKDSVREGKQEQVRKGLYLRNYLNSETSETWSYDFGFTVTVPKNSGYGMHNNPGNLTISNNSGELFSSISTKSIEVDGEFYTENTFDNGMTILYKHDAKINPRLNVREGRATILYNA